MMSRHPAEGPACERCAAPLALHLDEDRWIGCPYPQDRPRHCAYQGCGQTVIADTKLWLCNEHLPGYLR